MIKLHRTLLPVCIIAVAAMLSGCGLSGKKLAAIEEQIKMLKTSGVPDTLLEDAEVLLYQFKTAHSSNNPAVASSRPNGDSLVYYVERAQTWFNEQSQKAEPAFKSCREAAATAMAPLTGMHKKSVDSLAAIADSLAAKSWFIQANQKCADLGVLITAMTTAQATADKLAKVVTGRWKSIRDVVGEGANAVETRVFTFNKDGSLYYTHRMKGKTSETLKENWQFNSWGTWTLKGDTIYMGVNREKCLVQNFTFLRGNAWETQKSPTYDSTITDGSKNLLIVYQDLKDEFVKF